MARQMKDSGIEWIGDIPSDWEVRRIKTLPDRSIENSFIDGDWIESPYIEDEGIRYLTTGNIGDGVYKYQGNGFISEETFNKLNCKFAYPGDLVISRLNAPYGRSCILPSEFDEYVLAVDNVILRTSENKRFICYLTQCDGYHRAVEDAAKGTTMQRISRTNLGNIALPLASDMEQEKIADYLDQQCALIDTVIEKTKISIEEYKKLKQAVITEAVTKGVRGERPMKDSGIEWIGEIPVDWDVTSLGQLSLSMRNGYVGPTKDIFYDEGVRYIQSLHVKDGSIDFSRGHYYVSEEWANVKPKIHLNDILIVQTGDIGQVALVNEEYDNCNCHALIIMTPIQEIVQSLYLTYYLRSVVGKELMLQTKTGALLPHLNSGKVKFTKVVLPSIDEQREISDYLDKKCVQIDRLINNKEKSLGDLELYKKSLIYEYVTGKKEVPQS